MQRFLGKPMAHLLAFAGAVTVGFAAYLLAGVSVSPAFEELAAVGWALMLVLWADADARRRRLVPCYDFGLLVGVYAPLSVVWYCVWSRGRRGLLVVAALAALWVAPNVLAQLLWLALYGRA